jgi:hypothetical protein
MKRSHRRIRRGRSSATSALWDIHIYNPRTQKTTTHRAVAFEGVGATMGDAPAVVFDASKKYRAKREYILAVPHRG